MVEQADRTAQTKSERLQGCALKPCATSFIPKRIDQRFCSKVCKEEYYRQVHEKGLRAMTSKGIHARTMESPQLKKLHAFLADGEWHSTRDIGEATGLQVVGTAVSELRRCGFNIKCIFVKSLESGGKVYAYKLLRRAA